MGPDQGPGPARDLEVFVGPGPVRGFGIFIGPGPVQFPRTVPPGPGPTGFGPCISLSTTKNGTGNKSEK